MIDPKLKTKYFAPKLKKDYEYFAKRLKEFEKKKKELLKADPFIYEITDDDKKN